MSASACIGMLSGLLPPIAGSAATGGVLLGLRGGAVPLPLLLLSVLSLLAVPLPPSCSSVASTAAMALCCAVPLMLPPGAAGL
jgi:hypothetical protein